MSHQTFAIITRKIKSENQYLLFLNEAEEVHFFVWIDQALNGFHRWEDFDIFFQKYFQISEEIYELFIRESIALNKVDEDKKASKALVQIIVSESFYEKTNKEKGKFLWKNAQAIQHLVNVKGTFRESDKWITRYLLRHPLDVVNLPISLLENIKIIQEAREKNKLVIFAGAGVSVDSGAPLWSETKIEILESLGLLESTDAEAPVIGQWLFNERGEKEYNDKLRKIIGYHNGLQPNPLHHQLLRLRPRHLITTNYDDFLEQAMDKYQKNSVGKTYAIIRRDEDLPYAIKDEYIIKMHGDWDLMNFVFKEDDYLNYSKNFPLIESFVKGIFSSHVVLFIGFSFSDPNLKQIVNWVKNILEKDFQPAYLFQVRKPKSHEITYFGNRGIRPIVFDEAISCYLEEIDGNSKIKMKSMHGKKTHDFLRLLEVLNWRDYERLKRAKTQHVIDQMYESLLQFDAFNCIPPYSFEKLFPFSPTSLHPAKLPMNAEHSSNYHLQTGNEEIISLMESLEFKNNRIIIKKGCPKEKEITEVANFETKLTYIFDKLRSSQIHCIQRKGDRNNHNRIQYGTQFDRDLLFSQWVDYEYKPMLENIYSREWEISGLPDKPLREGLLNALVLTKFHFLFEGYILYSSIAIEALKRQDYTTFFICQYNKKYLGIRVIRIADWKKYPKDLVAQIRDELETIDLHGLLNIMQSQPDVKELLDQLLDGELLDRYSRSIRKAYNRVLYYYTFFQNPNNQSSGSNDAFELVESYMSLHWIFHSNGILFGWDDYKFVELTELAFEGMVASICTSEQYKGRLEELEVGILNLACHFLKTKQINKILDRYKPDKFPIKSQDKKKRIIKFATNWFSSCFNESVFSFEPSKNDLLVRYLKDKIYVSEVEQLSNNFFLLFSFLDFEDLKDSKEMDELIDVMLKSLLVNFEGRSERLWEVKHFVLFLEKNIEFFNNSQIEWAIKVITRTRHFNSSILYRLNKILEQEKVDFRLNKKEILLNHIDTGKSLGQRVEQFIYLFPFLSSELQKILTEEAKSLPESNRVENLLLWLIAKNQGMFPDEKELSKTQYGVLKSLFPAINKITFEKDGTPINFRSGYAINVPYWLAVLHYQPQIGLGNKTVQKLLKLKSFPLKLRWMLDPKNFNYKNFNCYWVFFYNDSDVLSKIGAMKIPVLRKAFQEELKKEFSPKLAEIYHTYFSAG